MSVPVIAKRFAAVATIAVASAGAALFSAPAYADTVTVNYSCEVPFIGTEVADVSITVDAPATATVGDTVDVTVTSGPTPFVTPIDLAAGSVTASADYAVSGAQTGDLALTGPANPDPIPANSAVTLPPMTGQLTLTSAGEVDITPGVVTATAVTAFGNFVVPCTPTSTPPAAAVIQVSDATDPTS